MITSETTRHHRPNDVEVQTTIGHPMAFINEQNPYNSSLDTNHRSIM